MRKILLAAGLLAALSSCSTHKKIDSSQENLVFRQPPITQASAEARAGNVASQLEEKVKSSDLFRYPEITVEFVTRDAAKAVRLVKAAGGKVLYDPNLGVGGQIPFLVATLPPEKVVDRTFIGSLGLDSARVLEKSEENRPLPLESVNSGPDGSRNLYVPWADIKLNDLRARKRGEGLGENVTIAVIDTGVDASHPAMEDRVVYWADQTQQTRTPLSEVKVEDGKVTLMKGLQVPLPGALDASAPVYAGLFDEQALGAQLKDPDRNKDHPGLDLNRNGSTEDTFAVLVGKEKESGLWVAFVGVGGDGLSEADLAKPIADFNDIRAARACRGESTPERNVFVEFPARNRRQAYPLLLDREGGVPAYVGLGMDLIDHGTHVAGIAAGHGLKVEGAAPKAKVMALKVCSNWSCTDEAILRGLVDTFYNPYGCVPDVVNLSLGGHLGGELSAYDLLFRDLSAKFGATFFISSGNDGPGYRSLNGLGASGPAVMVGAHISRDAFQRHYNASPGQSLPDNLLFFFSSTGPSFTGLLRPHIAAPGSALSSIPLADGGFKMMQGTSMASPIAAGAAAALLSLAKKAPEYEKYARLREKKIHQVLNPGKSWEEPISLQQFPLALRASLTETAHRMANYADPQQGFGLIDVNAAFDLFLQKLKSVERTVFSEYAINGNTKDRQVYDRSPDVARGKPVELGLIEDSEAPEQDMVALRGSDLQVKLDYVEVQDALGHVQRLSGNLPFSILQPGEAEQEGSSATLVLANPAASSFVSLRKTDRMEPGKTYVAHYSLLREGQVVDTLVDTVHNPITLGDGTSAYDDLKGLSVEPIVKTAAFVRKGQAIQAAEVHHYPIALTGRDQGLSVQVGIPQGENGAIYVDVYDPDGKKMPTSFDRNGEPVKGESATRRPGMQKPVARAYVNTEGRPGIYEVTIAAASGFWLSNSHYDLLATADRLRISHQSVELSTPGAKSELPHEATLSLLNSSRQVGRIDLRLDKLSRMERLERVKIVPQRWTFRRLHLPERSGGAEATTVTVAYGKALDAMENFRGRIDNHLYVLAEDGESFTPVYTAEPKTAEAGKKEFKGVKLDGRELFVALETFTFDPNGKEEAFGDLDVAYEEVAVEGASALKAEIVRDAKDLAREKSGIKPDLFLVKVSAAGPLGLPVGEKAVPVLRARLVIQVQGGENTRPLEIPVTISQ